MNFRVLASLLLPLASLASFAPADEKPAYRTPAENPIVAQTIVDSLLREYPELVTAGIHAVPPGGDRSIIVASTLSVIGKKSDPEDVDVATKGFTQLIPNAKLGKFGVMLPFLDRDGHRIGALGLALKYHDGDDQVRLFARATEIRNTLAHRIGTLAELLQPAHAGTTRDAATAFVDSLPVYAPQEPVSGKIVVWGHGSAKRDFMARLTGRWFREFQCLQPGVIFENRMYGTSSAIPALSTGAGNLAILGEEISPDAEEEFRRAKGYAPTQIRIATGSLDVPYFDYAHMVFVHADNPLAHLSLAQLDGIFGDEHRRGPRNLRTWGDLGLTGEWADKPIQPYFWPVDEDFALFLRELVLKGSHRWNTRIKEFETKVRPDGTPYEHAQQILEALANDRYGIAVSTIRFASPEIKALPVSSADGGPYVTASRATLIDESYPLTRYIPALVDRPPGEPIAPQVREFLRYVLSRQGQQALVETSGYLPLDSAALQRERRKLE